jgi:hypothetical protein
VVTRVQNTQGRRRPEILSEYSTEQVDEDAMTEFLQSTGCRRQANHIHNDKMKLTQLHLIPHTSH